MSQEPAALRAPGVVIRDIGTLGRPVWGRGQIGGAKGCVGSEKGGGDGEGSGSM